MSDSFTYTQAVDGVNATLWNKLITPTTGLDAEVAGFSSDQSLANILWEEYGDGSNLVLDKVNLLSSVHHLEKSKQKFLNTKTRRVYSREGFALIEIFVPEKLGLKKARNVGSIAKSAFEGKRGFGTASGIEFKDISFREGGTLKGFFVCYVKANFEYQEAIAEE